MNLDALQGTLDFSELRLQAAKSDFRQTAPTRISIARGVARLESLNANGPNASLTASGSIDLKGEQRLQLDAVADMRLAALAGVVGPLESDGQIQLEAHVGGTLIEPRITGFVTLQQAALALPDPQLQATEVNLKATLAGDEIKIGEFSGLLNGGSFTGGGDLKITRGNVAASSLHISARDVFLEYPAGVKTTSSLGLKLVLRDNRPTLEGHIEIQDGYWDAPFEIFGSSQNLNQTECGYSGERYQLPDAGRGDRYEEARRDGQQPRQTRCRGEPSFGWYSYSASCFRKRRTRTGRKNLFR